MSDEIHAMLREIWDSKLSKPRVSSGLVDRVLSGCEDAECDECAMIICPHADPMHFHHDGCPSCDTQGIRENGTEQQQLAEEARTAINTAHLREEFRKA